MEQDMQELYMACYEVAQDVMFQMRPINVSEIENLAKSYYKEAEELINMNQIDPNLIIRVVDYIAHTHAFPSSRRDSIWFQEQLMVLIELACPNVIQTRKSARFLEDILKGISLSKEEIDDEE